MDSPQSASNASLRLSSTFGLLIPMCFLSMSFSCNGNPSTVVSKPMGAFYKQNKWIPLPMPDSRFSPGTIFTFTPETGIRYVSSLKTCKVPNDVLAAVAGLSPKLTFDSNADYGASADLQIGGVSAGPEFSKVKRIALEHDVHGPTSLDLIKVQIWLTDPANARKFPEVCTQYLSRPDTFIVQEAYQVTKGKYSLIDNTGAKLKVTGLNAGPVKIDPSAHIQLTTDGSLEFSDPVYTAIRRVRRVSGDFQTLGDTSPQKDADEEILRSMR